MTTTAQIERIAANDPQYTLFRGPATTRLDQHIALAEAVANNTHIQKIEMANTGMTNAAAVIWGESLKTNSSITHLDFGYNKIDSKGIEALAAAFAVNKTLREVKLHRQSNDMGAQAEKTLVKMWKTNTTMTRLYVTLHDPLCNTTNTRGEVRNKTIAARIAAGKDWMDLDPARKAEYQAKQDAERKAKEEAEAKANAPISAKVASTGGPYTYKQLTCAVEFRPDDVDISKRPSYLSDAEFEKLFKMNKESYAKLPKWKRVRAKKALKLH